MANRTKYAVMHRKTEIELVTVELVGTGAADPTINDATQPGGSELATAVRTGAGAWTVKFKKAFPKVISAKVVCIGTTAGLQGKFTAKPDMTIAQNPQTVQLAVGAAGTDAAAADTVVLELMVRNSGRN